MTLYENSKLLSKVRTFVNMRGSNRLNHSGHLIVLSVLLFGFASSVLAEVKLPHIFGNDMVLQRGRVVPVWGWADAGEEITVEIAGQALHGKADEKGNWVVHLKPMQAGGPYEMIFSGKNEIKLTNVMVGEVWVCSGQSNMERSLKRLGTYKREIESANNPNLRLFYVPKKISRQPAEDVEADWKVCRAKTAAGFSAAGYFFGKYLAKELDVPIGLIQSAWGGTRIEPWIPPSVYNKKWNHPNKSPKQQPSVTYNGMIHPLIPYAIRGAIWYQGESNCIQKDRMLYYDKFKTMVESWRMLWGQGDFPFYFVQLAPYIYTNRYKELGATELPLTWEAQTACLQIPNTGMVVTVDIGDVNDIHPKNKHDIGKRLALWALAKDYGRKDIVYSGPLYKSMAVEGDKIRIRFEYTGGGLISRDGKDLTWFEIAGADRNFYPARAKIDGNTVIVSCDKVKKPVAVRFGWDQRAEPNLSNKEGLPASPFRTDKW